MEHKVHEHKTYMISAKSDTTVTDVATGWSKTIPANTQDWIYTISDKINLEGDYEIDPFELPAR
jgi:hypothetical protein